MKITIAQMNPLIGDIEGNITKMKDVVKKSSGELIIFPELSFIGYPPRDLLEKKKFVTTAMKGLQDILEFSEGTPDRGILCGTVLPTEKKHGTGLYNSAVLVHNGKMYGTQHKSLLPTYDVFDEARYFDPASHIDPVPFNDETLGISICEDAWNNPELWSGRRYQEDPISILAEKGTTLFITIAASPFTVGKETTRMNLISSHAKKYHTPFIFVNQVGGNDELIFDGRSMYVDENGNLIEIFPSFEEFTRTISLSKRIPISFTPEKKLPSVYHALALGVRDYMKKCGFKKVVLGLSGGIDSSVACCIAAEAVGHENVLGVSMPSPYSSESSVTDAQKLAEKLHIEFTVIPISTIFSSYLETLREQFEGMEEDVTEENIQARIRGNILMALSNKFGHLVLSSGNKSELAVGYCTLYGDMTGGLGVLSDVPKTMVYELAHYINRKEEIIPQNVIEKPPSAELRPDQVDQDTLPPYEILDRILRLYIDEGRSSDEIIDKGIDPETVQWVLNAVKKNEYKRKQAPPGLKVTTKAFGMGRRMPIAAKYKM